MDYIWISLLSKNERKEMEKKKKEDQRVGGESFYFCGDDCYC